MRDQKKRKELVKRLTATIKEMEVNQLLVLKRGDIIQDEDRPLYSLVYKELKQAKFYLEGGGDYEKTVKHLHHLLHEKQRDFILDVLDTMAYPKLQLLTEYY